jgi:hypothetical protein
VVPASRPATNLEQAISLARAGACQLVVLCSRDARATEVEDLLTARGFGQATVVDMPDGYTHPLLDFSTSALTKNAVPESCTRPNGDLSVKRNLGLILARMLGWNRIFFIDDDIRDLESVDLHATMSMLTHYSSAGMRVTDFPDNSVVCHAHRQTGESQDIFVSGSVLAVNSAKPVGFFPEIYNEDWLFFYDDARTHQLKWSGRNATQLRYDPFCDPRRAEREEFGDVIAEGLYALLHERAQADEATDNYWRVFLGARWKFLNDIIERADSVTPEIRSKMVIAVQTAMLCLMQIQAGTCGQYVRTWRQDLQHWRARLEKVGLVSSMDAALRALDLTRLVHDHHVLWPDPGCGQPVQDPPPAAIAVPQGAALDLQSGESSRSATLDPPHARADDAALPPGPPRTAVAGSEHARLAKRTLGTRLRSGEGRWCGIPLPTGLRPGQGRWCRFRERARHFLGKAGPVRLRPRDHQARPGQGWDH